MSLQPDVKNCLYRELNINESELSDKSVMEVIKTTREAISEQYKDCSAFWSELLSSERARGLLRQFNSATGTDHMRTWRWRERKSFPLSLDELAPATDFVYAIMPFNMRHLIKNYSVHYMWMGTVFKGTYPLFTNMFGHYLSMLPYSTCKKAIESHKASEFQLNDVGTATVMDKLFFERLVSLHSDIGNLTFANIAMTPYTSTRMPLRTILLSTTSDEDRLAEIQSTKVTTIMFLAYLFNLPMDYFCREDYISDTIADAIFVRPNGLEYQIDPSSKEQVSLLKEFVKLPRNAQKEILIELAAN